MVSIFVLKSSPFFFKLALLLEDFEYEDDDCPEATEREDDELEEFEEWDRDDDMELESERDDLCFFLLLRLSSRRLLEGLSE